MTKKKTLTTVASIDTLKCWGNITHEELCLELISRVGWNDPFLYRMEAFSVHQPTHQGSICSWELCWTRLLWEGWCDARSCYKGAIYPVLVLSVRTWSLSVFFSSLLLLSQSLFLSETFSFHPVYHFLDFHKRSYNDWVPELVSRVSNL